MRDCFQAITSAATSLSQIAATFKRISPAPGTVNLDYGGGQYDKATRFLAGLDVQNHTYDPYNRTPEENLRARLAVCRAGGADTVTVNNVLNVIAEPSVVDEVIRQAANGCKNEGNAWFLIYEGNQSGLGVKTSRGWQRNQRTTEYVDGIARWFGEVTRAQNLIRATRPFHSNNSLFEPSAIQSDLDIALHRAKVPRRHAKWGVGKRIGGSLYVHRDYLHKLPLPVVAQVQRHARDHLPPGFDWTILKWHEATDSFSFIHSPDFDTADEPVVGDAVKVHPDGTFRFTRQKADPQIYHHKWNFVGPDYTGFDCEESMLRSLSWAGLAIDRARIGTRSYWEAVVES